ncbi:RelA/SpoT family protein [Scytonema sp. HK-05]|uniref:bifunctional (p)ppGpp synthetase/guanosine-3',5'-bis(diphosphate) 3'-pyrophosphohydrolase n=1 Tax=Scytonema sp. HK-05 TaxID=1137095 RepID=UPI000937F5BD|nr:TGS domain-containing protein [Scytonema sp. HK-05]OKH60764.1 hypothetical protein NIES2130_01350 [Scytonema sp. HK-05]BAY45059.1 RelA/SpoT family protein [Scytonema sp. HK-05]
MSDQTIQINGRTAKEEELEKSSVYMNALERLTSVFSERSFFKHTPEAQAKFVVETLDDLTQDDNLSFAGLVYLLLSNDDIQLKDNKDTENLGSDINKWLKDLKNLSNVLTIFSLKGKIVNNIENILNKEKRCFLDDSDLDKIISLDENTDVEEIIMMIFVIMSQEQDIRALVVELVCRLSFLIHIKKCIYWHNQPINEPLKSFHNKSVNEKLTFKFYVAFETFKIFVPIANRLGMWSLKWQLEDLSFKQIESDIYSKIAKLLNQKRLQREDYMKYCVSYLEGKILEDEKNCITKDKFSISGRPKSIYSTYTKMKQLYSYEHNILNRKISFQEFNTVLKQDSDTFEKLFKGVHDLFGVRLICDSLETCYQVLDIIQHNFKRQSTLLRKYGELADYIAVPKPNGYKSIHLVVHAPVESKLNIQDDSQDERKLEVQIRTDKMHKEAEYGVAAHWKYKELGYSQSTNEEDYVFTALKEFIDKKGVPAARELLQKKIDTTPLIFWCKWYQQKIHTIVDKSHLIFLSNLYQKRQKRQQDGGIDSNTFEGIKHFLSWLISLNYYLKNKRVEFGAKIYVFTPEKNVVSLKKDSTPVDFAYRIHTDVGNHCIGALVNEKIVPLSTPLQNGDLVEIMTQKSGRPSLDWLNFVQTYTAKNRIKNWYKRSRREENIARGRELLEKELGKTGFENLLKSKSMQEVAEKCNYQSLEDLLAALGHGEKTTSVNQVVNLMQEKLKEQAKERGWKILEKVLINQKMKIRQKSEYLLNLAQRFSFQTTDDLLAALGEPERAIAERKIEKPIDINEVVKQLQEVLKGKVSLEEVPVKNNSNNPNASSDSQDPIKGIEGLTYYIAGCCQPIPGEEIIGIITQGRGISIHHQKCKNVHNLLLSSNRYLTVNWNLESQQKYPVGIQIETNNRIGILKDITSYLAKNNINISEAQVKTYSGENKAIIYLSIDIINREQLEKCVASVVKIKDVVEVRRVREVDIDSVKMTAQ